MRHAVVLLALAIGCNGDEAVEDTGVGLLGTGLTDVFPNPLLVDGDALAIPLDALPVFDGGTPLPVDRFGGWRTGFSPGQTTVFRIDGIDEAALPDWREPTPGESGVLLVDLTDGVFLPAMAELDAHPDASTSPSLMVRPLVTFEPGHHIATVLTTEAVSRPARIDALLSDEPPSSLASIAEHMQDTVGKLVQLGVAEADIAVVTDFYVDTGRQPLEQLLQDVALPSDWEISRVREADDGDRVAPLTYRAATGSFAFPSVLGDDGLLDIDSTTGTVSETGTASLPLYVHIPESVADAEAGTVPVVLFGHGIFSTPGAYLDTETDGNGVLTILNEMGAIGIGTNWAGLSSDERVTAIGAAQDIGRIPMVCDRLVQSNLGARALQRLILDGDLLDDAVFEGNAGQPLAKRDQLLYYGISLGGIEGAVQVASGAPFDAAVLHVGGGMWSTMLERSTQWITFESFLTETYPDPADRQVLYAATQLFWDPVDPVGWMDVFPQDVPTMWQEALGDEQVPNMTTRMLARSVGAPVLEPAATTIYDVNGVSALEAPTVLMTQYDPAVGLPADVNRPPTPSGAHSIPRGWSGQHLQTQVFLNPDAPGTVLHACGDAVCSASNQGTGE